jgi:hypothetical protein
MKNRYCRCARDGHRLCKMNRSEAVNFGKLQNSTAEYMIHCYIYTNSLNQSRLVGVGHYRIWSERMVFARERSLHHTRKRPLRSIFIILRNARMSLHDEFQTDLSSSQNIKESISCGTFYLSSSSEEHTFIVYSSPASLQ